VVEMGLCVGMCFNWMGGLRRILREFGCVVSAGFSELFAGLLLKRATRQAVSREFPDFSSICSAPIEEVEEAFKHLGLYKQRAKQLKEPAKVVVERYGGRVPDKWEELVSLPGVGVYLAGAVLSFGYGKRAPVLDSNVIRLLTRLTGTASKRYEDYLRFLWRVVPDEEHEYFNYGLIDLGASVCRYRRQDCGMPRRPVQVEPGSRTANCAADADPTLLTPHRGMRAPKRLMKLGTPGLGLQRC